MRIRPDHAPFSDFTLGDNGAVQDRVGSNTNPVAPVVRGAIIAAGSMITDPVPPEAVVFGRAPQVNKEGRAAAVRRKQQQKTQGRDSSDEN